MSHGSRRRRQAKIGFTHIAKLGRPVYRRHALSSIHDAIAAEHRAAQRRALIKKK